MPAVEKHREYEANCERWARARDAAAGQDAVHKAGHKYLPKLKGQSNDEYDAYKTRALYYNATGRTVDGMSGLIFRRPPTIEMPESAAYLEEDIDTAGTPLVGLCENAIEELLQVGRVGLLSEYPPVEGARTQADEQAIGARPYITTYCAESIWNWRFERIGNRWALTMATLYEQTEIIDADGSAKMEDRWRKLRLVDGKYIQELWMKGKGNTGTAEDYVMVAGYPVTPLMANTPLDFIPFLICGVRGIDAKVTKSPTLDLADVNLSHYRSTADYEHGLHFTGLPTPFVSGHAFQPGETMALGSTEVKGFPDPAAKAYFLEFTGVGLTALSTRLTEKEAMMAALGARMLGAEKRAAETAETAAIHRSGENSVLASLAIAAGRAITQAVNWCLMWAAIEADAKIELNTDYLPAGMTAQDMTALVAAWQSGAIAAETLFDNLQRGEIARQGVTFEEEQQAISDAGPPLGSMGANDPLAQPAAKPKRSVSITRQGNTLHAVEN